MFEDYYDSMNQQNKLEIIDGLKQIENMSDKELYELCQRYGGNAKEWLKKFGGLLPDVYERKLYKKYGFISIHEFAKKLCGMNEETVNKILNLARKLVETPTLLSLFKNGEVGWSKMEKIAGIANQNNEKDLVVKVQTLPRKVLENYTREQKRVSPGREEENDLTTSQGLSDVDLGQGNDDLTITPYLTSYKKLNFSLSSKTEKKLRYIKSALEKNNGRPLSWNQVFAMWPYQLNKEKIVVQVCPECAKKKGQNAKTRHIPIDVRRILIYKYGNHCAFPKCYKAIAEFHHLKRYSIHKSHDPDEIVPLCKDHHDLVHSGLIENEEDPIEKWKINDSKKIDLDKEFIDERVKKHRSSHSRNQSARQ